MQVNDVIPCSRVLVVVCMIIFVHLSVKSVKASHHSQGVRGDLKPKHSSIGSGVRGRGFEYFVQQV